MMVNTVSIHIRAGVKKKSLPIHYLVSKDTSGKNCFFVIICPYQKLRLMLSQKEHVKPQDYGHVVASGFGKIPPQDVRDMLAEDYGFRINFSE